MAADLAARLARLPRAPRPCLTMVPCDTGDNTGYRDGNGRRWIWDHEWEEFGLLDLTDPATVGCLAAWARELYALPMYATPAEDDHGRHTLWNVLALYPDGGGVRGGPAWRSVTDTLYDSEGEAWASALIAKLEAK